VLRAYTVSENGTEHIIQFALEYWLISDLYSFLIDEPASYNIDALEDAELILISKAAHEVLLKKVSQYLHCHATQVNIHHQLIVERTLQLLHGVLKKFQPRQRLRKPR
jgi:hypothetical protein